MSEVYEWLDTDWSLAIKAAHDQVAMFGPEAEACGYVEDARIVVCRNNSREPGTFAFTDIDCIAVYDAMERGVLDGVWHSHPKGQKAPSTPDWDNMPRGVPMYIVVLDEKAAHHIMRFDEDDRPKVDREQLSVWECE